MLAQFYNADQKLAITDVTFAVQNLALLRSQKKVANM
jgi:hypothetical protein